MNKQKISSMPDPREEALLRRALVDLAEQEIHEAEADGTMDAEYRRTLPAVKAHIAEICGNPAKKRPARTARRSLKAAILLAAVLVAFSGVCLASPAVREQIAALVENTWGTHTQLRVDEQAATENDSVTVEADDPRLAYVYPDWCLHYYPMEVPRYFDYVYSSVAQDATYTYWETAGGNRMETGFWYLDDAARKNWLELDQQQITFAFADEHSRYITFAEDGSGAGSYDVDTQSASATKETIDGKEVYVIERGGEITFVWQEGGHMLSLATTEGREILEYVFSTVERIR